MDITTKMCGCNKNRKCTTHTQVSNRPIKPVMVSTNGKDTSILLSFAQDLSMQDKQREELFEMLSSDEIRLVGKTIFKIEKNPPENIRNIAQSYVDWANKLGKKREKK